MAEHPIQGMMATAMQSIKEMVDVNTIVGTPVETKDGTVIIPISKVAFGFAAAWQITLRRASAKAAAAVRAFQFSPWHFWLFRIIRLNFFPLTLPKILLTRLWITFRTQLKKSQILSNQKRKKTSISKSAWTDFSGAPKNRCTFFILGSDKLK